MKEETQGIIAQLENRGFDKCKHQVLDFLSQNHSVEELTDFFGMFLEEAFNMFKSLV